MPTCDGRTGLWLIGAGGSIATTVIAGTRLMIHGLSPRIGLVSDAPEFESLALQSLEGFEFGGHDVRAVDLFSSSREIAAENGSVSESGIRSIEDDLRAISARVKPGISAGGGHAIEALAEPGRSIASMRARDSIARVVDDLSDFRRTTGVERVVVINVASTEPPPPPSPASLKLADLEVALDREAASEFRPGLLYAYAALSAGCAFINFTASPACLVPSIEELAVARRLPYFGSDGKTGETLVKSALAPMFRDRQLEVLSWVGYNILGNRDGAILADPENKHSKVASKDGVLGSVLGKPLRTRVGIDYVESLGDSKVAWDYIHFRGFLGHAMSMQFTWQGCDSVLAAPLVLDLARFADLALRRGESGPMNHLACFFKSPIHGREHDFHRQNEQLRRYARGG